MAMTRDAATIDAATLKKMLHDGGEIAVLDVREEGIFAKRHMLLACPAPLSQLEIRAPLLVPERSTRTVLVDDGGGLAARAAGILGENGYASLFVLDKGIESWAAAGYEIYSGVNVPSKVFGEFVEHKYHTPRMEAAEIKARIDRGDDIVILDSRPLAEYRRVSIPGGVDCPGAELAFRVHDIATRPDTLVVVNCAGRTRSIIGAQSLINAGIPNKVVALKNGTMGWHLAGFEVARGQDRVAPAPTARGIGKAREVAARVAKRFGVRYITADQMARFAAEAGRTLYRLDVRSPEEYAEGHLPSTVSAPGGQLVQATDHYVATRNARIALIDDHGVRATMTASWLLQMGWKDVYVVEDALKSAPLERGAPPLEVLGMARLRADTVSARELRRELDREAVAVIDLSSKPQYADGHVPGAWHAIRANLAENLGKVPGTGPLVLTSPDGILARLAAPEAARLTNRAVRVLDGGTDAWRAAGLPLENGQTRLTDMSEDVWVRPHDRSENQKEAMKEYLTWEVDLIAQIERDDDIQFHYFPQDGK
jgi:rhodanese-related sulfurtransferase